MAIYWIASSANADRPHHPSSSWANWKNGKFIAWDRDAWEEKEVTLPKEFVVIAESWSIKGYLQDKGWVWSNEIYSFANDILTVRDNNGGIVKEGLWKDIKDYIKGLWLKLTKNVHYIDPADATTLRTFCIKWAWLKSWMEVFTDENRNAPAFKRIALDKVAKWKTWAVTYEYPVFKVASDLTADDRKAQQALWVELVNYKEATTISAEEYAEEQAAKEDTKDDDLPF